MFDGLGQLPVRLFEARLTPLLLEQLPHHVPHPLPVPMAIDLDGVVDPPAPSVFGIACEVHPSDPEACPQTLEVRTELRGVDDHFRLAWLAEIAALMTEWIDSGMHLILFTIPFEDQVFAQRVIRHALLGVQSIQGTPLWAHPAAIQVGVLPFELPATQQCTSLGERTRWRTECIRPLEPIDPATGLPTWHIAGWDCLRLQHLPLHENGNRILNERAVVLCQTDRSPDLQSAGEATLKQVEVALQSILGFRGLAWPKAGQESGSASRISQI
jgi:hypothetical protein